MANTLALPKHPRFVDFRDRSFTAQELQLLADSPSLIRLDFKNCGIGDDEVRLLCHLPNLQSMWLEGTAVTDRALVHLARLPKLDWLILDNTAITGTGFAAFSAHNTLRTLWLHNTAITDAALPLLTTIAQLAVVGLGGTAVTEAGLMALAWHPTVRIGSKHPFHADVMARFDDLQRQRASRTPPGFKPVQSDEDKAIAVLLGFMAAFTQWERDMANAKDVPDDWKVEQLRAAFTTYCTVKDRKYGGPNAMSFGTPPTYEGTTIFSTEWITARKVLFYTRNRTGLMERFMLIKKAENWLLDHKQWLGNGWERASL